MNNATILGAGIGDALGLQFELKKPDHPELLAWDGKAFGPSKYLNLPAGATSDDTAFTVALARSILMTGNYSAENAAKQYLLYHNSPTSCGMGGTTKKAMANLINGMTPDKSGIEGREIGGNGTAMRASPIGVRYRNDLSKIIRFAKEDAIITHNSDEPVQGEVAVALAVGLLASKEADKHELLSAVLDHLPSGGVKAGLTFVRRLMKQNVFSDTGLKLVSGTGCYVVDSVTTAFYCFLRYPTFEIAVEQAVRAGGDTDTNASITGAIAGTYYGQENIPQYLIDGTADAKNLMALDALLWNL